MKIGISKLTGNVGIINGLNHYIGMTRIETTTGGGWLMGYC